MTSPITSSVMLELENLSITVQEPSYHDAIHVDVQQFGASTDPNYCNQSAFQQAIDYCRSLGQPARLIIPKGVYYFHDTPLNDAHLMIEGLTNFTLDGCGSELIFEQPKPYIHVVQSNIVKICNLTLDWNWELAPLASVGTVTNMDHTGAYFDMVFPTVKELPEELPIRIVGPFDSKHYTPGTSKGVEFRPYRNQHILMSSNETTNAQMEQLVREISNVIERMDKLGSQVMRFYTVHPEWTQRIIKPGQSYNFRHYEYDMVGIFLFDSSHITLDRVTLYSCPGSGIVGNGDISHIHMKRCTIGLRPGTNRSISTSVDCLHIANSKGHFIIEDCDMGYAGDDCINIHDNTSMGVIRVDDHTLIALRIRKHAVLFEVGSSVELRNPDLSPTGYQSELTAVRYEEQSSVCHLTFKDKLPDSLHEDTVLFNQRFTSENFIIRNNRFTNNRARGVLIHASNGIIENNVFENIQGAAIQIETGCELRWSEGTGVHNILIRNNIIRNCDLNAWQMAVIYMGVYLPTGRTSYPIFNNIVIKDNTIVNCPRMAMFLSSCANLLIQGNAIINANQMPLQENSYGSSQQEHPMYGEKYRGVIHLLHASHVVLEDNSNISTTHQYEHAIIADSETTHNITIRRNVGC